MTTLRNIAGEGSAFRDTADIDLQAPMSAEAHMRRRFERWYSQLLRPTEGLVNYRVMPLAMLTFLPLCVLPAHAADLKVFASRAIAAVLAETGPEYENKSGQ